MTNVYADDKLMCTFESFCIKLHAFEKREFEFAYLHIKRNSICESLVVSGVLSPNYRELLWYRAKRSPLKKKL